MEREQGSPEFNFLYDTRCPEHAYYRWRLFSLAAGDTLRRWVGGRVGVAVAVGCGGAWLLACPSHWPREAQCEVAAWAGAVPRPPACAPC